MNVTRALALPTGVAHTAAVAPLVPKLSPYNDRVTPPVDTFVRETVVKDTK
jgi:hypothetical protein